MTGVQTCALPIFSRSFGSLAASGIRNLPDARVSYLRNAVKAVIDAYDGTTRLYVNDPDDPLIATWAAVYPSLFAPLAELPDGLDAHLRYPEGLFDVQTGIYEAYHVTDPTTFYQGDNLWTVPNGSQGQSQALPGEAYYVQMRLPDEAATEQLLEDGPARPLDIHPAAPGEVRVLLGDAGRAAGVRAVMADRPLVARDR